MKIGDTIHINLPSGYNGFRYIRKNGSRTADFLAGKNVVITKFRSLGNKPTGYKIYALFRGYGLSPLYIDYEVALQTKEIL